jgi:hypothetical protein
MILLDDAGMAAINHPTRDAKGFNGSFFALVEVYHELHCLNLVRKYVRRDEYSHDVSFQGTMEEDILSHVGRYMSSPPSHGVK